MAAERKQLDGATKIIGEGRGRIDSFEVGIAAKIASVRKCKNGNDGFIQYRRHFDRGAMRNEFAIRQRQKPARAANLFEDRDGCAPGRM